jgi:lysophospholipase L1-like esterase
MSIKETKAYPETGWGNALCLFLGFNGDGYRTVQRTGAAPRHLSAKVYGDPFMMKPARVDYVFIQFGHNDESPDKKERYATPDTFRMNLTRFVKEAREKGATPFLLTPVSRRKFDSTGTALETHKEYSAYVKEVAAKEKVLFIDLDTKSRELYQQMGKNDSKLLFMQLRPGEHPNYPDGRDDNTHFTELGRRWIAELILKELKN